MSVYVDEAVHGFGRMIMCHMVSPDLDELHAMADRIGVARRWFQDPRTMPKVSAPHYDIAKGKRLLAIAAGAKAIDKYQMSAISKVALARLPGLETMPARDPLRVLRGHWEFERVSTWLAAELAP